MTLTPRAVTTLVTAAAVGSVTAAVGHALAADHHYATAAATPDPFTLAFARAFIVIAALQAVWAAVIVLDGPRPVWAAAGWVGNLAALCALSVSRVTGLPTGADPEPWTALAVTTWYAELAVVAATSVLALAHLAIRRRDRRTTATLAGPAGRPLPTVE
jgi:hypothetical protein